MNTCSTNGSEFWSFYLSQNPIQSSLLPPSSLLFFLPNFHFFLNTTSSALSSELTLLAKLRNCLVFHSPCLFINLYCQVFLAKSVLPYVTCHYLKWKIIIIAGIKIPPFLWYVIYFFSSASTSGHPQYVYEISISSSLTPFNSSSSLPHSHTIYSVGSAPKCLSATLFAL